MPAPKRTPDQQVIDAVVDWAPNVTAAAEAVRMRPKSLRQRCEALGIDLDAVRSAAKVGLDVEAIRALVRDMVTKGANPTKGVSSVTPMTPNDPIDPIRPISPPMAHNALAGHKNASGLYQDAAEPSNFSCVKTATAMEKVEATEETVRTTPVKTEPQQHRPLRLKPAQQKRLEVGTFKLQAVLEQRTNENLLLERFFDDRFDEWLAAALEEARRLRGHDSNDETHE